MSIGDGEFGLHRVVLQLLRVMPFDTNTTRPEETEIRQMMLCGYRLLKAMVIEFPPMQQELSTSLSFFIGHLTADLKASDISPTGVIISTCQDNRAACLQVAVVHISCRRACTTVALQQVTSGTRQAMRVGRVGYAHVREN